MGAVMLLLGAALLGAAWCARDRAVRVFLVGAALLNLAAFAHMVATRHRHTWKLAPPSQDPPEPPLRR